jgi:VWFA-related protein
VRTIKIGVLLLSVALLWAFPLLGSPQKAVTLQRVDITRLPDIDVYLTVTDEKGNSVLGLTELEVTVGIDDIAQKITFLKSAIEGGEYLAVALLFDRSGSMKKALDQTKDAAVQFIKRLSVDDRMAAISFDDKVRIDASFSGDRASLESAIHGIAPGMDTALYDAVRTALGLFKDVGTKRQAILVLSDGKDTKSKFKAEEVLSEAKKMGVPIYALGLGDAVEAGVLGRLSSETGGITMKAAKPEELLLLYQKIADQLKNQYVLRFTSTFGQDDLWHKLRIQVKNAGNAAVSAQREFIASRGLGVSREVISSYEKKAEQRNILVHVGLGGSFGLLAGFMLILLIRFLRPDVSFCSPLSIGVILLTLLLGGIIAMALNTIGT